MNKNENDIDALLHAVSSGLAVVDQTGAVTSANSSLANLLSYDLSELVGMPVDDFVVPNSRDVGFGAQGGVWESQSNNLPNREMSLKSKSGERIVAEVTFSSFQYCGKHLTMMTVVDVSCRYRFEASLERSEEQLKTRNEELEQFVYTVSHDLKGPLLNVSAYIGKIRNSEKVVQDRALSDAAERVQRNARVMEELLDDLLQLSKVSFKGVQKTRFNLQECLEVALAELSSQVQSTSATVTLSDLDIDLSGQKSLFDLLFVNLISNALKYARVDQAPQVEIKAKTCSESVEIFVRDKGRGISPRLHGRVFGVFERFHPDVKEGTGMGLAIVKKIVERHGGSIDFHSAEDQGTEFVVRLPLSDSLLAS